MGGYERLQSEALLKITLLSLALWMNATSIYAQQGFLSIDCGSSQTAYNDSLGLTWVGDGTYIETGKNGRYSMPYTSSVGNDRALQDFRYFPDSRRKHCYNLTTTPNTSYFIRAMFYYNQSELLSLPIEFIVSINATNWLTMAYNIDSRNSLAYPEGIFHSPGSLTYLCLEPVIGVPFISSLELRPLDYEGIMYSYSGSTQQLLHKLMRVNVGASIPPVRYPDDAFDRLWESSWADYVISAINAPSATDKTMRATVNNVPPKVMQSAWDLQYSNVTYIFTIQGLFDANNYVLPSAQNVFAIVYCEDVTGSLQNWTMHVTLDGIGLNLVTISAQANMTASPNFILGSDSLLLTLQTPPGAPFGPILNAMEVLVQYAFNFSTTAPNDDEAITALKDSFNLKDWHGDPCTPVPHDWLTCDLTASSGGSGPCLVNTPGCTSKLNFLRSTYSVTGLTLSNLASPGFPLFVQAINETNKKNSLTQSLNDLTQLSMTSSGVVDASFEFLINQFAGNDLRTLDLSYNIIKTLPSVNMWSGKTNVQYLNLSHNKLFEELDNFANMPFYGALRELDLSYNAFTSIPIEWGNIATELVVLDLSHNQLGGRISSLDRLLNSSANSLQILNISDNNLTGVFSSSLFFSRLPMLEFGIFDRNRINGVLNLTSWQYSLLDFLSSSNTSNTTNVTRSLFSFVDNNISGITPTAEVLKITIDKFENEHEFLSKVVLLGGNPYCKGAKSYAERYLCRSRVDEPVPGNHHHSETVLIASVCGGITAVLLLSFLFLAIIWRLRNKVVVLREFQTALGDADVRPQFYKYNDLKYATREFHKENELGRGGFGIVYEASLNGTALAVKELFNSQKVRVLDDFLKEVVLITGIKHINLVQLKGCCIRDTKRFLVYELVENGNLAQCLWGSHAHRVLNWEQRFDICVGVAAGLSYLHEQIQPSILHLDIKPANILLNKNYVPKIADFGLARPFSHDATQALYTKDVAGTFGYLAPEYASEGQLSEKVDVYSYGIVVLEIISGRKCIDRSLPEEMWYLKEWAANMDKKGTLPEILDPQLKEMYNAREFVQAINVGLLCVQTDPQNRPTMSQAVTMLMPSIDAKGLRNNSNANHPRFPNSSIRSVRNTQFPDLATYRRDKSELLSLVENASNSSNFSRSQSSVFSSSIELDETLGVYGR